MPELVENLTAFPGISVQYDTATNPFFRPIVVEALDKINSCAAGKPLLKNIAAATPGSRADFPQGVNVMVMPQPVSFVMSGYKQAWVPGGGTSKTLEPSPDPRHVGANGCPFYILGGSLNAAKDPAASTNKQGSVCKMLFTNVQVVTTNGEKTQPYIVLAHELIHSWHCLTGIKKDGPDEEVWTTGIGKFASEPLSENVIRTQLGVQPRTIY
ncbi:MAG: M91 family zinc metallopeptidase [Gemmatimonadaceae bacterium]